MKRFLTWLLLGLAAALTGCATSSPRDAKIRLTATLTSPLNIRLNWSAAPGAAGYVVEWTPDRHSDYVVIAFLPPDITAYTHPDLMPQSPSHYRVRAFYGPATDWVEVSLPAELSDLDYAKRYDQPEDFNWAVPQVVTEKNPVAKQSIRKAVTATAGAPADLKARLARATVSGFQLTWTDHARDEDGYFLERKGAGSEPAFTVCAVLAPDINAFGYAFEPPMRQASFRVRAFYYGKSSNHVMLTTGAAPNP